jgi:hypothetical protein
LPGQGLLKYYYFKWEETSSPKFGEYWINSMS